MLTKIAGVSYDRAWKGRQRARIDGVDVHVLGFEELVAAKRASSKRREPGSAKALQDEADLQWLLEARVARKRRRR